MDRRLAVIGCKRFGFGVGEGWARCGLRRLEGTRSDMGVKGGRWEVERTERRQSGELSAGRREVCCGVGVLPADVGG
jgi:hypothetical protein